MSSVKAMLALAPPMPVPKYVPASGITGSSMGLRPPGSPMRPEAPAPATPPGTSFQDPGSSFQLLEVPATQQVLLTQSVALGVDPPAMSAPMTPVTAVDPPDMAAPMTPLNARDSRPQTLNIGNLDPQTGIQRLHVSYSQYYR